MKVKIKCPTCDSHFDLSLEWDDPKAKSADLKEIIRGWKHLKGVPVDDKQWDATYFPRHYKTARKLLKYFDWNLDDALDCMGTVYNRLAVKGFVIQNFEKILDHADKYKQELCERRARKS